MWHGCWWNCGIAEDISWRRNSWFGKTSWNISEEWVGVIFQYRPVSKPVPWSLLVAFPTSCLSSDRSGREWGQALSWWVQSQEVKVHLFCSSLIMFFENCFLMLHCFGACWFGQALHSTSPMVAFPLRISLPLDVVCQARLTTCWVVERLPEILPYRVAVEDFQFFSPQVSITCHGRILQIWFQCWWFWYRKLSTRQQIWVKLMLYRWPKVKILHQRPRSWETTPNQHTKWESKWFKWNGLQI